MEYEIGVIAESSCYTICTQVLMWNRKNKGIWMGFWSLYIFYSCFKWFGEKKNLILIYERRSPHPILTNTLQSFLQRLLPKKIGLKPLGFILYQRAFSGLSIGAQAVCWVVIPSRVFKFAPNIIQSVHLNRGSLQAAYEKNSYFFQTKMHLCSNSRLMWPKLKAFDWIYKHWTREKIRILWTNI